MNSTGRTPLRTAVAAAASDARIERRSLERLAAAGLPDPFPWDAEARQLFADLFFAGPGAIEVIETLDQVGLWVQLLPEWEPVRCKPHTWTRRGAMPSSSSIGWLSNGERSAGTCAWRARCARSDGPYHPCCHPRRA